MQYELLGTCPVNCRTLLKSDSLTKLREFGEGMKYHAIYKTVVNGRRFHNSTDETFLVEYKNDPSWIARLETSTSKELK